MSPGGGLLSQRDRSSAESASAVAIVALVAQPTTRGLVHLEVTAPLCTLGSTSTAIPVPLRETGENITKQNVSRGGHITTDRRVNYDILSKSTDSWQTTTSTNMSMFLPIIGLRPLDPARIVGETAELVSPSIQSNDYTLRGADTLAR